MKVNQIRKVVYKALEVNEKARNSDWVLFRDVCLLLGIDVTKITVKEMCENSKAFPSFESVTRARRKYQENGLFPATAEVERKRYRKETEFREVYSK